ncbi:hypothetical protein HPC37_03085 [Pasteurellaceae bacterium 20609_3]|uniref:capsular polysaccharide export protein, LipB/KpsS family n=1 Tax=Spirabiliibacterium mucosae TaxID=28156 RepID=UPI001AACDF9B|nr:hypothetical protein [Spirabiliibacterium mucosae]MBE2897839.1 hypothetical protein [Spirabiliibacterium mucosae]
MNTAVTWFDYGLWRRFNAQAFFGVELKKDWGICKTSATRIGWGRKKSGLRAVRLANQWQTDFLLLEDGFLRSVLPGVCGEQPLSIVKDDVGIYYDATSPSRLERILNQDDLTNLLSDSCRAIKLITEYGLSKYNNHSFHLPDYLQHSQQTKILLVDQTVGDLALKYGMADEATFREMFETAVAENPHAEYWIKVHPDVLAGKKQGYLKKFSQHPNVYFLSENIEPRLLFSCFDCVYTVTSQLGFEALLYNKKVITFGVPWYAVGVFVMIVIRILSSCTYRDDVQKSVL